LVDVLAESLVNGP
jgi:hypothetical protein